MSESVSIVNRDIERHKDVNPYHRTLHSIDGHKVVADVYRVLDAFDTGSAEIDHAVKKLLCGGLRGSKGKLQDYSEAIKSIEAAIKLAEQKELLK